MSRILVSYFSATGATKRIAEDIASTVNADLFEIEPVLKYTAEDLEWMGKKSRAYDEMKNKSFRPPIVKKSLNTEGYEKVILGFPVWWNTAPTIVNTFLDSYNLVGKKVYVFVTSGATGVEKSFKDLKREYPYLDFMSGKRFNGSFMKKEVKDWINS